ncbi:MAG: hypothetical protein CMJ46_00405 [Planctomyces sp.]|nr:hypothetical protein [Planctomyces sp.]
MDRSEKLKTNNAISENDYEQAQLSLEIADRTVEEAATQLEQARLPLSSKTDEGENTTVAQEKEQLARAQYELEQATVKAPANGIVQQLALRPGARGAAIPLRAALVFVDTTQTRISVGIKQNQLRYVQPGQTAEVVLKYYPGMTLKAEVEGILAVTSGGQVQSSGVVEDLTPKQTNAEPYHVVLKITDERVNQHDLPGGAVGQAAIYTDHVGFTHVIRRVMIRMQAWMNYIF